MRNRSEYQRASALLENPPKSREEAADAVRRMLSSRDWEVRNIAVKLVDKLGLEEFIPNLRNLVLAPKEAGIVKRNAVDVLGHRGGRTPETIDALLAALKDPYWEVRSRSALALWRLCRPEDGVEDALYELLFGAKYPQVLERPVVYVDEFLKERYFEVRGYAAQALGGLGRGENAFRALVALTTDENWLVRNQAAVALAELAAREREVYRSALGWVEELDVICEGALSIFPIRESVSRLVALMRTGEINHSQVRDMYLPLSEGWHIRS